MVVDTTLCVEWTYRKANEWVRDKIGIDENDGLLSMSKVKKIRMYGHWRRSSDSLVCKIIDDRMKRKKLGFGSRKIKHMNNISS